MKIDRVSATIRYSKDTGNGWKVLELGAEGTVTASEDWHQAQADLYTELGNQLKVLWSANGTGQQEKPDSDHQGHAQAPASLSRPQKHWCEEHQTEFKRVEKDGRVWYSHKAGKAWCKEK